MKNFIVLVIIYLIMHFSSVIYSQSFTNYTTSDGLVNDTVNCIAIDQLGNKWFGTAAGISKFDGNNWTTYTTNGNFINDAISCIAVDLQNNVWFGGMGGVLKFDGVNWILFSAPNPLLNEGVRDIVADKQGNIWIGVNGGLSKFDGVTWTNFTIANGLTNNSVSAIAVDNNNDLWIGTYMGGVSHYNGNSFVNYSTSTSLIPHNYVEDICIDSFGNKWFTTLMGLVKFDGSQMIIYDYIAIGSTSNYMNAVAGDSKGNIFLSVVPHNSFFKYDGTNWIQYTTSDGLAHDWVDEIVVDNNDNVWLATKGGVSVFNNSSDILENKLDFSILVYPNPNFGLLNLKNVKQNSKVIIYDLLGKIKLDFFYNGKVVNINDLSQGVYLIKVIYEDSEITEKLIKY